MKTLETKFNAIIECEKGQKSKTEIAELYGVPRNTLSGWIKNADSIKKGYAKFGPKRRNMRNVSIYLCNTIFILSTNK